MAEKKTVLYVGCGQDHVLGKRGFDVEGWREIRLDIDPECAPDLVGSMTDLSAVSDASMDAVYSSHTIEHLLPQDVPKALREVARVLRPDGVLLLTCPNIQEACRLMAEGKWKEPCYPCGRTLSHHTAGSALRRMDDALHGQAFHEPSVRLYSLFTGGGITDWRFCLGGRDG